MAIFFRLGSPKEEVDYHATTEGGAMMAGTPERVAERIMQNLEGGMRVPEPLVPVAQDKIIERRRLEYG